MNSSKPFTDVYLIAQQLGLLPEGQSETERKAARALSKATTLGAHYGASYTACPRSATKADLLFAIAQIEMIVGKTEAEIEHLQQVVAVLAAQAEHFRSEVDEAAQ